jgi:hypothetical protein
LKLPYLAKGCEGIKQDFLKIFWGFQRFLAALLRIFCGFSVCAFLIKYIPGNHDYQKKEPTMLNSTLKISDDTEIMMEF